MYYWMSRLLQSHLARSHKSYIDTEDMKEFRFQIQPSLTIYDSIPHLEIATDPRVGCVEQGHHCCSMLRVN